MTFPHQRGDPIGFRPSPAESIGEWEGAAFDDRAYFDRAFVQRAGSDRAI
jgi:hypothetical protein